MIKQLKALTINIIAGANIATVLLMLASGYSDRIHPTAHQMLSNLGMLFPFFLFANLLFIFFWLTFKWKKLWIPILGYILVFSPLCIYMPLHTTQEVPEGTIKIVSYNVCQYGGNYKYEQGFDTVFSYLKQQEPDIVCLQEDADTWRRFVFQRYRKVFPYNDTTLFRNDAIGMNGVGIHTRFPILRKERIWYESKSNGSVAYFLKVGRDTVLVVNNHLEFSHINQDDREIYRRMIHGKMGRDTARTESVLLIEKLAKASIIRSRQAEAVHQYIEAHRHLPVIVCGDFNDCPISYSHRKIGEGLTDCFVAAGRGLGLSYFQKGFFFRIDHIFCSDHFQPFNCIVDNKTDVSDHYPVVCWLKMSDKP
jgi:endonuclease/exonuclease/phosphatase (EEP) superfamily protein YafD